MRLGQPLDRALERLQERLPSREVAVLMTTIIIQQRAGGDTVRALQELGGTLEARKDLIREIRTVLSGSVFTSYVVAGIGIATIVLMNVFTPGVMREMTSSLAGPARARRGRDAVGDRVRADPGHDEGGRVTPLLAGAARRRLRHRRACCRSRCCSTAARSTAWRRAPARRPPASAAARCSGA